MMQHRQLLRWRQSVASSEKAGSVQPESGVMGNDVVSSSGMVSSETQVVLAGIGLDQTQVTVRQGERFQLTITYTPENVPGTGAPVWSSSAPDVASVDESGTVSALTQGSAVITATVDGFTASCQVTVEPLPEFVVENGVLTAYNGSAAEMTVPDGVTEIAEEFLKDNETLEKLILPDGLVKIGAKAFSGCKNLKEIVFPDTLTEVGNEAFFGCENLSAVELGENVTKIGASAFANCAQDFVIVAPDGSVAAAYAAEQRKEEKPTDSADSLANGAQSSVSVQMTESLEPSETLLGVPQDGWYTDDQGNSYYYISGVAVTGMLTIGQYRYIFGDDGRQLTGNYWWNNNCYYAPAEEDHGALKCDYFRDRGDGYTYYGPTGEQAKGWFDYSGDDGLHKAGRYYQDTVPRVVTGRQVIDGSVYFFDDTGRQLTEDGWSGEYYVKDGKALTGKQQIDGKWYIFGDDGRQLTGNYWWNNNCYYAPAEEDHGALKCDYFRDRGDGYTYYGPTGEQAKGWFDYSGADGVHPEGRYYQDTVPRVVTGYRLIEEKMYYFNSNGLFFVPDKEGWLVKDGKEYYFLADGEIVRPPVIDSVTVTEVDASTSNVTINASFPGSPCAGYSFDGGKTWQTSNTKTFTRGTVIAAGMLMVKDTTGGKGYTVAYDKQVDIPKVVLNGVYGIDVSKHQGEIDWNKVAASGVSFAIIRAVGCYENSRTSYIDPYFESNVRNAKAAGLNVGVYIYSLAKSTDEMISQVKFFLNSAEMQHLNADGIKLDYPVYIDYENSLVCEGTTYDERTNIVRTGMVVLDQNGYYPGFYTYHSFMSNFNVKGLVNEGYDFWYARYPMVPNPDENPSTTYGLGFEVGMWQYCSDGNINPDMKPYVDGVRTAVDLNRVYKDYPTLVYNKNGGSGTIPDPVDPVQMITVYDQNSKTNVTDSMDNLLPQIVQNEVSGFNNAEVWKAQAVAAHSWLLYQMSLSDTPPTVGLKTATQAVKNACAEVKNKIVTYNGTVANTLYGASNSTKTNSALNMWGTAVPYLIEGVDSPGDANATHWSASQGNVKSQGFTSTIGLAQMKNNIEKIYPGSTSGRTDYENWLKNPMRSSTGYVTSITVMGKTTSGGKFYDNCWGLFSPNFTMKYNGNGTWTFTTYGNGHGVGMSQWGAYGYAQQGRSWEWILLHYYPGTKVENY